MTDTQKLKIALEALNSIAALHLPKANTKKFWANKTMQDAVEVLAEDTNIARTAIQETA